MIFLPGSEYVVVVILSVLALAGCLLLSVLVGAGAFRLSQEIISKTEAYKRMERGEMNADRWWFEFRSWAGAAMFGSFVVFVYVALGPTFTLIKLILKGGC
jgi:hypothetical protein